MAEEGSTWWNEEQLASDYGLALHRTDAKFIALASHENVLALVEALEKAQHEAAVDWEAAASLNVENQELKRRIAELESRTVTAAAADVLAERQRQVAAEGWTAERDDGYQNSELADAAACYAIHAHNQGFSTPAHWPWSTTWWKQTNPRRDLVKAGALILAEIERLDRAAGIKWEAE
ncbi:ead/Ea22-like family protein [Raoultella planticola]